MKIIKTAKYLRKEAVERWNKVPGSFSIEINIGEEGNLFDITNDIDLSGQLQSAIIKDVSTIPIRLDSEDQIELVIDFESTGYRDPGSMHGGPDQLGWPPEGDDERIVTNVTLIVNGKPIGELSDEVKKTIEGEYEDIINEIDLDYDSEEDLRVDYEYDLRKDEPGRFGHL